METILEQGGRRLVAQPVADGRRRISVEPQASGPVAACHTTYPDNLIRSLVELRGFDWVCDEVARDEDPAYLERVLRVVVLGHVPAREFDDARMLDFGCGPGPSAVNLARMLPRTAVVGLEFQEHLLELARARAAHHGLANVSFRASPSADRLPDDLGRFRFINFGASLEHMLPLERARLLPQLWALLEPGGVLLISDTPHRWSPWESHTTGLPLLNYLPDRAALLAARRLSPRVAANESWEDLLRRGIRGGSRREVLSILSDAGGGRAVELPPDASVGRLAADAWYASGAPSPPRRAAHLALRSLERLTGIRFAPTLLVAIRKQA